MEDKLDARALRATCKRQKKPFRNFGHRTEVSTPVTVPIVLVPLSASELPQVLHDDDRGRRGGLCARGVESELAVGAGCQQLARRSAGN